MHTSVMSESSLVGPNPMSLATNPEDFLLSSTFRTASRRWTIYIRNLAFHSYFAVARSMAQNAFGPCQKDVTNRVKLLAMADKYRSLHRKLVMVSPATRHNIGHFGDVLLLDTEEKITRTSAKCACSCCQLTKVWDSWIWRTGNCRTGKWRTGIQRTIMEMMQWTKSDISVSQYADSHISTQITASVLL